MNLVIPLRAQIIAVVIAVLLFIYVFDLVRRKKLREEYSLFWMILCALLVLFAAWSHLLVSVTRLMGAVSANSVVFFFGFVFIIALLLHVTVRLSKSAEEIKNMAQKIALLEGEIVKLREERKKRVNKDERS